MAGDRKIPESRTNYDQLRVSSYDPNNQSSDDMIQKSAQAIPTGNNRAPNKLVRLPQTRPTQIAQQQQQQPAIAVGSTDRFSAFPRYPNIQQRGSSYYSNDQQQASIATSQSKVATSKGPKLPGKQSQQEELANKCRWWSQKSFQGVNLQPEDLVVNDEYGSPCYIISLSAYLELQSSKPPLYFPLDKFSIRPSANKVILDGHPNGGATQELPMNCSLPLHADSRGKLILPIKPKVLKSFFEEIYLYVDCGYLKLRLKSNGYYLALQSIEFHLSSVDVVESDTPNSSKERTHHELFYSTQGSDNSPLLILPFSSRYICENRIILTSNNSIQLVMDKFLIQRLYINQVSLDDGGVLMEENMLFVDQQQQHQPSPQPVFADQNNHDQFTQQLQQQAQHHGIPAYKMNDDHGHHHKYASTSNNDNNDRYQDGSSKVKSLNMIKSKDVSEEADSITGRLRRRESASISSIGPEHLEQGPFGKLFK